MDELKPCPFCGGQAKMLMVKRGVICLFTAGCPNRECKVTPVTDLCMTMEQAIAAWNRREGGQG